jgi:excisionase family DNA binding protein
MPTQPTVEPTDEPRFVSLVEASRRLAISEDTLRRRVRDGSIPALLLAGKYRIREDHLREWLEGQTAA